MSDDIERLASQLIATVNMTREKEEHSHHFDLPLFFNINNTKKEEKKCAVLKYHTQLGNACVKGPGYFFGNINFEIEVAQQGPYMYQHFDEVSGPRRPTGSNMGAWNSHMAI